MAPQQLKNNKKSQGYITLIAVILVTAAGLVIATSLILLGVGSAKSSGTLEQSNLAKAGANACAESALQQIRNNTSYTGTNNISLPGGSCTYTVTAQSGENRTITASGTFGTATRKVKILISQINPTITVSSWLEVAELI